MAHSIGSKPLLLKNFNLHEILNYSAKFSSATGNRSVAANISKGLKLFDDKFVSKISFTEPDFLMIDDFFIQGFVKAEMKKKVTYKPPVQIRTTYQCITLIFKIFLTLGYKCNTCTCPAGGTPAFCKHVFALLHAINDYIAKKLYEAPTERLQTWHQPKPVKMVPQTSEVFMREPAIAVENEIGFVEWAQNEIAVVPDFHKQILFSDEAHFWLNGYVNKQNCRIWSEVNLQVYVETPLHPEKLTVWCALWAGGILLQKR
ncbi:SWIM-type domain-containing protein [Trichonephila clavipes]|nr:SWIM-type domain-containing protein [Trichonephila clavipes]